MLLDATTDKYWSMTIVDPFKISYLRASSVDYVFVCHGRPLISVCPYPIHVRSIVNEEEDFALSHADPPCTSFSPRFIFSRCLSSEEDEGLPGAVGLVGRAVLGHEAARAPRRSAVLHGPGVQAVRALFFYP